MTRADVAVTEDPGACPTPILFAMAPTVQFDDEALWPVPAPIAGETTAPVYLATVPGRDGGTTTVAVVVEPMVDGADRDAIAAQVLRAIDWEPGLHPPAWPAAD